MALTATCWTCGHEREVDVTDSIAPWCGDECLAEFFDVVEHLAGGGSPDEIDLDPDSRLYREAVREIEARRRAERIYIRDVREAEYAHSRPKPMRAIYPC